jgi:hypothetical protein
MVVVDSEGNGVLGRMSILLANNKGCKAFPDASSKRNEGCMTFGTLVPRLLVKSVGKVFYSSASTPEQCSQWDIQHLCSMRCQRCYSQI